MINGDGQLLGIGGDHLNSGAKPATQDVAGLLIIGFSHGYAHRSRFRGQTEDPLGTGKTNGNALHEERRGVNTGQVDHFVTG